MERSDKCSKLCRQMKRYRLLWEERKNKPDNVAMITKWHVEKGLTRGLRLNYFLSATEGWMMMGRNQNMGWCGIKGGQPMDLINYSHLYRGSRANTLKNWREIDPWWIFDFNVIAAFTYDAFASHTCHSVCNTLMKMLRWFLSFGV